MTKLSLTFVALAIASLACGQVVTDPAPLPTASLPNVVQWSEPIDPPTPMPTATYEASTVRIQELPAP